MATELFNANLATATVTAGGTTAPAAGTSESWTVSSSAMFGAAATGLSQFHVADTAAGKGGETIAVTNVSGTTWTVMRGAEGTTPVAHVSGFTVCQVVTAGFLGALLSADNPPAPAALPGTTALLVPLYLYPSPSTSWDTLNATAPPVQYVIVNPASGPGSSPDSNWTAAIHKARAAGITVLGYVDTNYNAVPASTVSTNIGLWQSLYNVTSIFFDRVSSLQSDLPYYSTVCGYVHAAVGAKVVLNHGAIPDPGYAGIADILVVFENQYSAWSAFAPATWMYSYPPSKFCAFVWNCSSGNMPTVMGQAQAAGIGNLLLTDEADDNFTALPGYLTAEAALAMSLGAGLGAAAFTVRPSGDTSGAADVARLNSAITAASSQGGGTVRGVPSAVWYINAPIVLRSNVTLDMTGCVINEVANSNCNMLSNAAVTAAATGTGNMTSGANTLTTALATATAVVGQAVYVAGGSNGGSNVLCGIVGSVNTGAGTLTVVDFYGNALNAAANVTGGAVTLYNRDTNIQVIGGTWNRGNNGFNSSGTPLSCTTNLKRIDGLYVHDVTLTCTSDATHRGYNVHYGDCSNFLFRNITISASKTIYNTDGINGHGPLAFGKIENIFGTCGDDFVSLQCLDSGMTEDTTGNVTDVEVTGLFPDGNQQSALSLVTLSTSCQMRDVTARGIHGSSGFLAVEIGPLTPSANTSWVDNLLIEDVTNNAGAGLVSVYATYANGHIVLRDLSWHGGAGTVNGDSMVCVQSGTTLGALTVDGISFEVTSATTCGVQVIGNVGTVSIRGLRQMNSSVVTSAMAYINGATVDVLSIADAHLLMSSTSNSVIELNGTVHTVQVEDAYLSGSGAQLLYATSGNTATEVLMSNVTLDGAGSLADAESQVDFTITGLNAKSVTSGLLIYLGNSGSIVSARISGLINPGNATVFSLGAGAPAPTYVILDIGNISASGPTAFTATGTTPSGHWYGSVVTNDITVLPNNPAISTSASMFLDNNAGQVFEFFSSAGGAVGVFDKTNSKQLLTIGSNSTTSVVMNDSGFNVSGGSVDISTAGQGLQVKEGSNCKQGTATLSSGSVVVSNTSVTASSRIFLTSNADGGTPGWLRVSARSAGTSFTITSSSGTDSSTVAFEIFEPG